MKVLLNYCSRPEGEVLTSGLSGVKHGEISVSLDFVTSGDASLLETDKAATLAAFQMKLTQLLETVEWEVKAKPQP